MSIAPVRKMVHGLLVLSLTVSGLIASTQPASADATTDAMLAQLNAYRAGVSAPAIPLDSRVAAAAGHHAEYNALNNILGHSETPGLPGYTGTTAKARVAAAGLSTSFVSEIAASYSTPQQNVSELWAAPYHRLGMMHPQSVLAGWGWSTALGHTAAVADFVYDFGSPAPNEVHSPGSNQTGIPTTWSGAESPSPLPSGASCPCGFPIMVVYRNAQVVDMRAAEVVAPDGSRVPLYYAPRLWENDYQIIIPQRPLASNTTYHVRFDINVNGAGVTNQWDFSTGSSTSGSPAPSTPAALTFHSAWVDQTSYLIEAAPGTVTQVTVRYRNTGTQTWQKGVAGKQVNLGLNGDVLNFAGAGMNVNWLSANRLATTTESSVAPGQIGTFTFQLRTPSNVGFYNLNVRPVAEGVTWLEDQGVFIAVRSSLSYHSTWLSQSAYPTLRPGETSKPLTISFTNTGTSPWNFGVLGQQANLGINLDDRTWSSLGVDWPVPDRVAGQSEKTVAPGAVGTFTFQVKAPNTPGVYLLHLRPVIDGTTWMEDQGVWLRITVAP